MIPEPFQIQKILKCAIDFNCRFSSTQGFLKMVQEVHDMAGQHETIAENLTTSIIREVHAMLQELKQERKKVII